MTAASFYVYKTASLLHPKYTCNPDLIVPYRLSLSITMTDYTRRKIVELRDKRHWTQGQLAQRAGLTRSHINAIENGTQKNIYLSTAYAIARAFNISLDDLVEQ